MCILRPVKANTQKNEQNFIRSSKSHFPPPTSLCCQEKMVLRILENNQLHQMKKSNDIREQNKKQAACKIITELSDGLKDNYSQREDFNLCPPKHWMYHQYSDGRGWKTPHQKREAVSTFRY